MPVSVGGGRIDVGGGPGDGGGCGPVPAAPLPLAWSPRPGTATAVLVVMLSAAVPVQVPGGSLDGGGGHDEGPCGPMPAAATAVPAKFNNLPRRRREEMSRHGGHRASTLEPRGIGKRLITKPRGSE
jgi:hypothetical protein